MSPLEQYMYTCKKPIRATESSLPDKATLRKQRQHYTIEEMAEKHSVSYCVMRDRLSLYGIESGMRYTYQGKVRKYQ